ncbi:MAG: hypothetical protein L3J08_09420 [Flavobacteriaceae bacterium]|nr:hypothetical protein [Flavobacteriaceae bacterium]
MKNILRLIVLLGVFIFAFSCDDPTVEEELLNNQINNKEKIKADKDDSKKGQKIFSISDFEFYAKQNTSIISKLSDKVLLDFRNSLKFIEGGILVTAKYTDIEKELSKKEVEIFWLLFGITRQMIIDHKGYKCVSPSNCKIESEYICMNGC